MNDDTLIQTLLENKWLPVSYALKPSSGEEVWTHSEGGVIQIENYWRKFNRNVTHWQPLIAPKPPRKSTP